MGPPSDVCGFINHEISPINYSYIYHKATEIRQLNAILGAQALLGIPMFTVGQMMMSRILKQKNLVSHSNPLFLTKALVTK